MRIRSIRFLSRLVAGVLSGLVILMMSITGVMLTYERQIVAWAEDNYVTDSNSAEPRVTLDRECVEVKQWRNFADNSPGTRARSTDCFLHTGRLHG